MRGSNLVGQRVQPLTSPSNDDEIMPVGGKLSRELGPDTRRGAGHERRRAGTGVGIAIAVSRGIR